MKYLVMLLLVCTSSLSAWQGAFKVEKDEYYTFEQRVRHKDAYVSDIIVDGDYYIVKVEFSDYVQDKKGE